MNQRQSFNDQRGLASVFLFQHFVQSHQADLLRTMNQTLPRGSIHHSAAQGDANRQGVIMATIPLSRQPGGASTLVVTRSYFRTKQTKPSSFQGGQHIKGWRRLGDFNIQLPLSWPIKKMEASPLGYYGKPVIFHLPGKYKNKTAKCKIKPQGSKTPPPHPPLSPSCFPDLLQNQF